MTHFDPEAAESAQFECTVWAYRRLLRPAPRKPGGFAAPRKGRIASDSADTLKLSGRGLRTEQAALSEAEGFTRELLTAKQQRITRLLEVLIVAAGVGLIVGLLPLFMPHENGGLSLMDALTNVLFLFALSFGLTLVVGLLVSVPTLLQARTVDLFALRFRGGKQWEFGVPPEQSGHAVRVLQSLGIAGRAG